MFALLLAALSASIPSGASVETSGRWTINEAPPAPLVPETAEPPLRTADRIAAERRFSDYAKWQAGVRDAAMALHRRLQAAERGNYVDMRFEDRAGRFRVVYSFLRDGERRLRRHSQHRDFAGETVRFTRSEQSAALEKIMRFAAAEGLGAMGGSGAASNRAEVRVSLTRAEWEALVRRRGFVVPEAALLTFAPVSAAERNRPLAPELAAGIRHFARREADSGPVISVSSSFRIALRNGCFRVADGLAAGAHVLFPVGQQLFVDSAGYLAFGEGAVPGYARVGEEVEIHGRPVPVTRAEVVAPIRAACGEGEVVAIEAPKSAHALQHRMNQRERDWTARLLREDYGFSESAIAAFFEDCERRGVPCRFQPPPPPRPCPAGTKADRGQNCRDARGLVQPVPEFLKHFQLL